jgi:hypothetical protein
MSRITELCIGSPIAPWERLGLQLTAHNFTAGTVRVRLVPDGELGLQSVGLDEAAATGEFLNLDGALVHLAAPARTSDLGVDDLGVVGIDHVVALTPDLGRTAAGLERLCGVPLRRVRDAPPVRQGFVRLGEVVLELVQGPQVAPGPARWWGMALTVADLDAACRRLGTNLVSDPRPPCNRVAASRRFATRSVSGSRWP